KTFWPAATSPAASAFPARSLSDIAARSANLIIGPAFPNALFSVAPITLTPTRVPPFRRQKRARLFGNAGRVQLIVFVESCRRSDRHELVGNAVAQERHAVFAHQHLGYGTAEPTGYVVLL